MGAVYTAAGARESVTGQRTRVQGWGMERQIWAGYFVISVNHIHKVRMKMRGFYRMTGTDKVKHFVIDVKKNDIIMIDEKKSCG